MKIEVKMDFGLKAGPIGFSERSMNKEGMFVTGALNTFLFGFPFVWGFPEYIK